MLHPSFSPNSQTKLDRRKKWKLKIYLETFFEVAVAATKLNLSQPYVCSYRKNSAPSSLLSVDDALACISSFGLCFFIIFLHRVPNSPLSPPSHSSLKANKKQLLLFFSPSVSSSSSFVFPLFLLSFAFLHVCCYSGTYLRMHKPTHPVDIITWVSLVA